MGIVELGLQQTGPGLGQGRADVVPWGLLATGWGRAWYGLWLKSSSWLRQTKWPSTRSPPS